MYTKYKQINKRRSGEGSQQQVDAGRLHRMKREYNILDLLAARLLLCRNVAKKESACLELLTTSSAAHQATLR